MTYRLTVEINHKHLPEPMEKIFYYTGDSLEDCVKQIETLPFHQDNLKRYKQTKFKDVHGATHKWRLDLMPELN